MKQLSILKPHVRRAIIENEIMEKVTYLHVPAELDSQALKKDIKLGASQFTDLNKLIEKENEPKSILIKTHNLEQGYLAITYLAAGFERKGGMGLYVKEDEESEAESTNMEEWEESPLKIPLINGRELEQTMRADCGSDVFACQDVFMKSNRTGMKYRPYWMNCIRESICVVLSGNNPFGNIGYPMDIFSMGTDCFEKEDYLMDGLNYFSKNKKVYILHIDPHMQDGTEELPDDSERGNGTWEEDDADYTTDPVKEGCSHLVLGLSADEVSVNLKKETEKNYYKLLFRGNFAVRNISTKRGFSYDRLANIVAAILESEKCKLVENIVKYAVKDWKTPEERPIENKDFYFMDRFCRTASMAANGSAAEQKTAKDIMMKELIGMEDVKKQVINVVNVMKYNRIREKMGISGSRYHNVHVMLGAPGTAKTTVAQLMGQIMVEERLLADNRFTCINGAELKGMYVGHSAPRTKALFENYDIIVIDEAYSLVGDRGENDSYTKEALAQLIIELENHSADKLVIFAGYGGKKVNDKNNKMKDFLDANPGIKSRITSTIYFDSYSPDEMVQIFFRLAKNGHYLLDENCGEMLRAHFEKRVLDDNFGNGREARSLLETAVIYTAGRVLAQNKKTYTRKDMQIITCEDVRKAIEQSEYAYSIQNARQMPKSFGFTAI